MSNTNRAKVLHLIFAIVGVFTLLGTGGVIHAALQEKPGPEPFTPRIEAAVGERVVCIADGQPFDSGIVKLASIREGGASYTLVQVNGAVVEFFPRPGSLCRIVRGQIGG